MVDLVVGTIVVGLPVASIVASHRISHYRERHWIVPVWWRVVAWLGVVDVLFIFAAIVFPVVASARQAAVTTNRLVAVEKLGNAIGAYQSDWSDTYPPAENWRDVIHADPFKETPGIGQAFNKSLSEIRAPSVEDIQNTPVVFESKLVGRNLAGGAEIASLQSYSFYYMADGLSKRITPESASGLDWKPVH